MSYQANHRALLALAATLPVPTLEMRTLGPMPETEAERRRKFWAEVERQQAAGMSGRHIKWPADIEWASDGVHRA